MARMIPAGFDPATTAPGEQMLFHKLAAAEGTDDWIVLHSLDIAHHTRQIEGEMDFLIIAPGLGVLCIEVKSHRSVLRGDDGWWRLGADPPTVRGPFKQAAEAMHSIRDVLSRDPQLAFVPFCSAVFFTHLNFNLAPIEWCEWQIADKRLLELRPVQDIVRNILGRARDRIVDSPSGAWFDPALGEPTSAHCERILQLLRPRFEFFESPRSRRNTREDELRRYTDEQVAALNRMERNSRVLFEGPAGTGKTLLAIEAARRLRNAGQRTALICFNRLLASFLRAVCGSVERGSWVGSFHSLLVEITDVEPPQSAPSSYWTATLPDLALERLVDRRESLFDAVVLDEAQDLFRRDYLDVIELLVASGLGAGTWRFFGDFTNQAIYDAGSRRPLDELDRRTDRFTRYELRENCRNTPRIASAVTLLTGSPSYAKVLRPDNGVEPQILLYRDAEGQVSQLAATLNVLRDEGYGNDEIAILSKNSHGCVEGLVAPWSSRISPLGAQDPNRIRSGTIHAFKGLEAPAVIVTDIDRIGDDESDALLYVALSRATDRLVVFVREDARRALRDRLGAGS